MNAKSDPTEEERKGGSGLIGKMILSINDDQMAMISYVPPSKIDEITADSWLKEILRQLGASADSYISGNENVAKAIVKKNEDKGLFPLKLKDAGITNSIEYLKKKGLFPDKDDDSDDEYVFGDDDFPS